MIFFKLMHGSSVWSFAEASSIPQTTTTYRIRTEHLLLKPYEARFVQKLYEEDFQDRVKCYYHY